MASLKSIPGITDEEIELLEAAGYLETAHLKQVSAEQLLAELEQANEMLEIAEELPSTSKVETWLKKANSKGKPAAKPSVAPAPAKPVSRSGKTKPEPKATKPTEKVTVETRVAVETDEAPKSKRSTAKAEWVNHEAVPEVLEMIEHAPLAIPLPVSLLAEQGIAPGGIAVAPVLNRASGDLEIRGHRAAAAIGAFSATGAQERRTFHQDSGSPGGEARHRCQSGSHA